MTNTKSDTKNVTIKGPIKLFISSMSSFFIKGCTLGCKPTNKILVSLVLVNSLTIYSKKETPQNT